MTDTYQWSDAYRLGIPGVDQEHQTFFALLRALEAGVRLGDDLIARAALGELRRYAELHFTNEEEFLDAVGYPDLPAHQVEHRAFVREVALLESRLGLPTRAAVDLARTWLQAHILGTDRRYTTWLDGTEAEEPAYPAPPATRG